MRFGSLIFRNVMRRKLRSSLTIFAVAIAVGSVVSLVGIANGFKDSFMEFYQGVDIDMVVVRSGSQRRLTSTLDESLSSKIATLPGVKEAVGGLADVVSFPDVNLFVVPVSGLPTDTSVFDHFRVLEGERIGDPAKPSVMLGVTLADTLQKKVGETVEVVEEEPFNVVAIFESDNVLENGSMIVSLPQLQRIMGREGQISGVSIVFEEGVSSEQANDISAAILKMESGLSARTTQEHVESLSEIQVAVAMAWLTSTVAILIGSLGTLNTMFMSIQERTPEIGILKAIGWERPRIIAMILGESILLSLMGGVVGTVSAILLVKVLTKMPAVNGLIQGQISGAILVQAFVVAAVVGLLGGLVPAISASRLAPTVALKQ